MANQATRDCASVDWSFATSQSQLLSKLSFFSSRGSAMPNCGNSLFSDWPTFHFPNGSGSQQQRAPSASFLPQTPPWIDDLLNDNPDVPPRKSTHRRSSSDSATCIDAPVQQARIGNITEEEECERGSFAGPSRRPNVLRNLDEEELAQMFADIEPFQKQRNVNVHVHSHTPEAERRASVLEAPSISSDHDSDTEQSVDDRVTGGVAQLKEESSVRSFQKAAVVPSWLGKDETSSVSTTADPTLDPKRAKRVLANRQSAQRSRVRKLQYIAELERSVNALQAEVSTLLPQVSSLSRHRVVLNVDNGVLKQRLAALTQEKILKDAYNKALQKEAYRLRQLFQQQRQLQMHKNLYDLRRLQHGTQQPPASIQTNVREADVSSVVTNHLTTRFKEDEDELVKHFRLLKTSGCSTNENGIKLQGQLVAGIQPIRSDFRVASP